METLQALYNSYDGYVTGNALNNDYDNFELQSYAMESSGDPRYLNIDLSVNGTDFLLYMKRRSQWLSSKYLTLFLSEIKQFPSPDFFKNKHIKKINEIRDGLASKYPQYKFFVDDINEALEEIEVHMKLDNPQTENNPILDNKVDSNPKIKWLGNINVLTTLFYDLMNGQDRNAPLIETTKKDIIDLIVNNFVDSDGIQFSKHTIETNLRDSTPEKKAKRGDRIELGNVKLKNKKEI
jgi:hypothetical protein